ncbi:hypothetical protein PBY51_024573 [Eleginops maclovinus]|uniref:Uncharacterized protein n=1 Tax=Eleginops maclovinus TaxID=56733 RepID=A0AAN7Y195_ELEMC|nr:hypothetical protein PBY51_024573 [Eleginops maclovinus]
MMITQGALEDTKDRLSDGHGGHIVWCKSFVASYLPLPFLWSSNSVSSSYRFTRLHGYSLSRFGAHDAGDFFGHELFNFLKFVS